MDLAIEVRSWTKGLNSGVDRGVGACVVSPCFHRMSLGFSGFPVGIKDTDERLSSAEFRKYHTVHAELNAIINARCSVESWVMYVTESPCHDCCNAIIQAGIIRVVCNDPKNDSNWYRSQLEGLDSMREAGILVEYMEVSSI